MKTIEIVSLIANIATAIGVILAAIQLWLAGRQSVVEFEDSMNKEYRDLIKELPTTIILGGDLSEFELDNYLNVFYRYIDLTNEQIYLRKKGRITKTTWKSWEEGIRINLSIFGFQMAWCHIRRLNGDRFNELEKLLSEQSPSDPKKWS